MAWEEFGEKLSKIYNINNKKTRTYPDENEVIWEMITGAWKEKS